MRVRMRMRMRTMPIPSRTPRGPAAGRSPGRLALAATRAPRAAALIGMLSWALALVLLTSPAAGAPRFAVADPVTVVNDTTAIEAPAPTDWNRYQSFIDAYWLRPLDHALALHKTRPAADINSLDEVPASTWYRPPTDLKSATARDLQRGNTVPGAALHPGDRLTVLVAHVEGPEPYVDVRDPRGGRLRIAFDDPDLPEVRTAAAVIASRLLFAAGYHVLPISIDRVRSDAFVLGDDAVRIGEFGGRDRLQEEDLEELLNRVAPDGEARVAVSALPAGTLLGGFPETGTRQGDPNDRIAHQDRRSLRGLRVIASWIGHTRLRTDRTLDIHLDDGGYVRHYLARLGAALGGRELSPHPFGTEGRESYWQMGTWMGNIFALGFGRSYPPRPTAPSFHGVGAFTADGFDPVGWRSAYAYAPFREARWEDILWGARLVASFTSDQIVGAVAAGELSDRKAAAYLAGTLIERRDRIAGAWFRRLNAADEFRLVEQGGDRWTLTFDDLGVRHGSALPEDAFYVMRFELPELGETLGEQSRGGRRLEFDLAAFMPPPWKHRNDPARYAIAHIRAYDYRGRARQGIARVHIYFAPEGGPRIVGIERT